MQRSLGNTGRNFRGNYKPNTSIRDGKHAHGDWLKERAARESEKGLAGKTGMTPKAVSNLRRGLNKISFDNLIEWMRADPQFAAELAEYAGLILPGEAEFAGALTKAFNAYQRKSNSFGPTRVAERASVDASAAGQSGSTARDNLEGGKSA